MGFYEAVSGARLHAAMYRPFESRFNYFNATLIENLNFYLSYFLFFFKNFFQPLLFFRILKLRFIGVGIISSAWAKNGSISGVIARSAGLRCDVRAAYQTTYAYYKYLDFKTFLGTNGDLYDRMLLMTAEIIESTIIISQLLFRSFVLTHNSNNLTGINILSKGSLEYITDTAKPKQYV
jgi:NADH-quinone oxidoreductase subunit D